MMSNTRTTHENYFNAQGFYVGTIEANETLSPQQLSLIKALNKDNKRIDKEYRKVHVSLVALNSNLAKIDDEISKQRKRINALTRDLENYKKNHQQ